MSTSSGARIAIAMAVLLLLFGAVFLLYRGKLARQPEEETAIGVDPAQALPSGKQGDSAGISPLPDPPAWVDPLEKISALGSQPAFAHSETPMLAEDATEEKALADAQARWSWLAGHAPHENDYLKRAQELRQLALEAVKRWPSGKRIAVLRGLALHAAEFFPPLDEAGAELWEYALAEAASQRGSKPEAIALREVQRAYQGRRHAFVPAYGKVLLAKAPGTKESYAASLEMGKSFEHWLKNPAAARQAYLEAAKSSDAHIRVAGLRGALQQAMTRADSKAIVEDAPALLKEESVKPADRAWITMASARAYFALRSYDEALRVAKEIQKQFPNTPTAKEAQTLEAEVVKKVFSEAVKP